MAWIKLSEWADQHNLSYLTSYRWFRAGKLPTASYQTESGTILVDDSSTYMKTSENEAISLLLKKTTEISKNNGSPEDLAAFVVQNFNLQIASEEKKNELQNLVKNEEKAEIPWNSGSLNQSWAGTFQTQPDLGVYGANSISGSLASGIWNENVSLNASFSGDGSAFSLSGPIETQPTAYFSSPIVGDIGGQKIENKATLPIDLAKKGRGRPKKNSEGEKK